MSGWSASWVELTPRYDGLSVRFAHPDTWAFRQAVADLKAAIPPTQRRYDPATRCWTISVPYEGHVRRWAARWFAVQRRPDRAGAPGDPAAHTHTHEAPPADAYGALHLLPSAPAPLVKAAYRTLAQLHHPDRGGDAETMKVINGAYELLSLHAEAWAAAAAGQTPAPEGVA